MDHHRTSHTLRYITFIVSVLILMLASPTALDHVNAQTATPTRTPTPINLGNFVWNDLNSNGSQDLGEPGIGGVSVQLWNSGKTLLIDSTVTNSSGNYSVTAPIPGNYRIRVLLPTINDQFSPKDAAGGDNTKDSDINSAGVDAGFTDIFTIANNVISMTNLDAGIIPYATPTPTRTPTPVNLGNFVWNDLNENGAQDAGEPGIECMNVQLWNSSKTLLIDTAVTNSSGIYSLTAPTPGDYRIRVVLPTVGDQFSPKDAAGGDNTKDSDINSAGVDTGFTDIFPIANNVISITNLDAGIIRSANPIMCLPTATSTETEISTATYTSTATEISTATYTSTATEISTATYTPTATAMSSEITPLATEPQLLAPVGIVNNTIGNPVFTWTDTDAPSYQLFVGGAESGIFNGVIILFDEYVPRQNICNGGICSVLLPDLNPAAWLYNGEYIVYLKSNTGEWQGPFLFTIAVTVPDAPAIGEATNTQNPQPTLHWTLPGDAVHAAFFHVYIAPADDLIHAVVDTWLPRDVVCGSWNGTICVWAVNTNLQAGKAYHIYMQSWGTGGYSVGGLNNTGWSLGMFNVGGPTPSLPDATNFVYAVNDEQVTITFPDDAYASSVYFFIGNVGVTPIVTNFMAELNDGQMGCNDITCTFNPGLAIPLTTGTYTVYVQPKSSGGPRGDGIANLGWFDAGTFDVP